jgi:hypothetical protein
MSAAGNRIVTRCGIGTLPPAPWPYKALVPRELDVDTFWDDAKNGKGPVEER